MPLTNKQLHLAQDIDTWVKGILRGGGGNEEILEGMHAYMNTFKKLMDSSSQEQMNDLAARYTGFHRFAKLLENLAKGLADGTITVPD